MLANTGIIGIRGLHPWFWVMWAMLRFVTIVTSLGTSVRIVSSSGTILRVVGALVIADVVVVDAVADMGAVTLVGVH